MIPNISDIYKEYFSIGSAVGLGETGIGVTDPIDSLSVYPEEILSVFNSFTPENALKAGIIHPEKEIFNFAPVDKLVKYAITHNKELRGHPLIWASQLGEWMKKGSKKEIKQLMEDHIYSVMTRYPEIKVWDVVNEAITDEGKLRGDSLWYRAFGGFTYISMAFEIAHRANPNAKLLYNDYNFVKPQKLDAILRIIDYLKLIEGYHLYGIGIQGHWHVDWPKVEDIQVVFDKLRTLGLKIHITELDICLYKGQGNVATLEYNSFLDTVLAARYVELFTLFKKNADIIENVTFWGIADNHTWLNRFWDYFNHSKEFRQNYPLLFDKNLKPKKAYYALCSIGEYL